MRIDLDTLKKRVLETTQRSTVAGQVEDVTLESDRDDEGVEFLRVIVQVKNSDQNSDADFEDLLEEIEKVVADVDERYPSVRFLDAA